jgi:hypothetical protein
MAYRRSRGKAGKVQPAVHTLTFATSAVTAGNTGTYYIDLSQVASLVNRRFYRQGLQWAVANFKLKSLQSGSVQIGKLPNTWVMSNAWEKGFRAWQKMNKDAMEETSVKPKFLDFKIYADGDHHAVGDEANLLPLDYSGTEYVPGEWDYSKFVIPRISAAPLVHPGETVDRDIVAVGPSYATNHPLTNNLAVSLIEGYAASRGLPDIKAPNTPADADDASGTTPENWLAALQNEGTDQDEQVLEDMITENNQAPYPFENGDDGAGGVWTDTYYPGGANQAPTLEWHDTVEIYSASGIDGAGIGTQNAKGGMFPCGLIRIDWSPEVSANLVLQIDLVAGPHRGYLCAPMTEM